MSIDLIVRGQLYINETTGKLHYYGFPSGGGGAAWHEAKAIWDGSTIAAGTVTTLTSTTVNATTVNASLVGNVTGNCSGSAATVTNGAQPNITSLGTLTTLTVDNITVNGAAITSSTGAISFSNDDLTTTGDVSCANVDATSVDVDGSSSPVSDNTQTASSGIALKAGATNGSYAGEITQVVSTRAASSSFKFIATRSGGGSDVEHNLRGDGNGYCDGSWIGGGADFAEYMEWADGNPNAADRTGMTVTLVANDDGKPMIRLAQDGDTVHGAISVRPTIVGNSDWSRWQGKYLKDVYGRYDLDDNGERQLNPDYDETLLDEYGEHSTRDERREWDIVGLIGLVVILDGQPTDSRWFNLGPAGDGCSRWLIR